MTGPNPPGNWPDSAGGPASQPYHPWGQPGVPQQPSPPPQEQQPSYPGQQYPGEHSQQAYPGQGYPEPGYPQPGYPQPGPQQGYPQDGYPQQGYPPPSHPGQSHPGQSHPGQSHQGQGYQGQGYPQQGYPGQQYPEQHYPPYGTQQFPQQESGPQFPAGPDAGAAAPPNKKGSAKRIIGSVLSFLLIATVVVVAKGGLRSLLDGDDTSGPTAPSLTGPFDQTPAESYPEGEAGISLPAAKAVPGFSKAKVQAALEQVKKGLIAARLDPTMVVERDPSGLIKLLAPSIRSDIEKDFTGNNFLSYASQVAPGFKLTSDAIRVKGEITFSGGSESGVRLLEVVTKFVWVYPFDGDLNSPGDHLVIVQDEVHWLFPAEADVDKSDRGMWINEAQSFATNIDCDLLDKSLLALGKPEFRPGAAEEDPDAAFDPNRSFDIEETC